MRKLRTVSLFSGAGGLDYGFEAAGFDTAVTVEIDRDCASTLRANRSWVVLERDIQAIPSHELLDAAGVRVGEVDLVIGGPPCQPFSKSAYWANGDTKRLSDPRAVTLSEYMRVVEELQPAAFVLENVHGITYSGKEEGFRLLDRVTQDINRRQGTNYTLSWQVLNAADYGVPQLRRRFFLVGHREGGTFRFPPPSHAEQPAPAGASLFDMPALLPYATAWDAIGGVDLRAADEDLRVRGRWADLLPSIPEGENYSWHTDRKGGMPLFGWRRCYWCFLLKLAKALPSWTLRARLSVPSTGRTAGSQWPRWPAFRRSRWTSRLWATAARSKSSWGTRCRHSLRRSSAARWRSSSSGHSFPQGRGWPSTRSGRSQLLNQCNRCLRSSTT
jgi:DNA (cytosine-5)-methyltransferase 1